MAHTDPIADMLTRIRNAAKARKKEVTLPSSRIKVEIAKILKEEGFIRNYGLEKRCRSIEELADMVDVGFVQSCNWDDRVRQAAEGHEKWMKQLSRRLAEGGAEELGRQVDRQEAAEFPRHVVTRRVGSEHDAVRAHFRQRLFPWDPGAETAAEFQVHVGVLLRQLDSLAPPAVASSPITGYPFTCV
jgi:ribosomal protein S8